MGEKDVDVEKEALEKKIIDADDTKKVDQGPITVVLKLDLHCAGCAKKVKKSIHHIAGVETVKADFVNNKLTITGKVDPVRIKERVEFKTKKKVEIISPKPKKDDKGVKKDEDDKPPEAKTDDQKPKEPQSTSVVLEIPLHCDGCSKKIQRFISKIDGVELVKPDGTKNLITVKGTMNVEELVSYLKEKLKRNVVIVPPKKEDDKGGEKLDNNKVEGGVDDKEKESDIKGDNDDDKKKNDTAAKSVESSGGEEKKKNDEPKATTTNESDKKKDDKKIKTDGSDGGDNDGKNTDVINKFEYIRHNNPPFIYTMSVYNQSYHNQDYGIPFFSTQGYENGGYANQGYVMESYPPHRTLPPPSPMSLQDPRAAETDLFSAENPNACSIM